MANSRRSYDSACNEIRKNKEGVEWLLETGRCKLIDENELESLIRNIKVTSISDARMNVRGSCELLQFLMKFLNGEEKRRTKVVEVSDSKMFLIIFISYGCPIQCKNTKIKCGV